MSIFSAFNAPFSPDANLGGCADACGDSFGLGSRASSIPWDVLFLFGLFTAIVGFLLAHWWLTVRMRKYQDRIRILDGDETALPSPTHGEYLASEYDDATCPIASVPCVVSSTKSNESASVLGKRSRDDDSKRGSERLGYADLKPEDVPPIKKLKITEEGDGDSNESKDEIQPQTASDSAPAPMDVDPPTLPPAKPASKKSKGKKTVAFSSESAPATPALDVRDTSATATSS